MATGAPNAILAINSLDRYITGRANQPFSNYLIGEYQNDRPYSNDFNIQSPGALIYGYVQRIVISQIQVQCNIPTVNLGLNDEFYITDLNNILTYKIVIPYGFYSGEELAAFLDTQFAATAGLSSLAINVSYDDRRGFTFESESVPPEPFFFPSLADLNSIAGITQAEITNVLKTYKLLGLTVKNSEVPGIPLTTQISGTWPLFLYTPYIDFYSDILTNYQSIKDTNTSVAKPKGLIARVYLSGNGNVQNTTPTMALGTQPFVVTADMNSPKIIKWSPDVAVPSIDFQLRDQYGDLIPGPSSNYSTEWQMTLLCVEGVEWRGE
jgi:hypothetical protein